MLSPGREFVGSPPPQIGGNTYHYHHGITYTHVSTKIYQQTSSFLAIRLDCCCGLLKHKTRKSFFKTTTCRSIDTDEESGKLRLAWLVSQQKNNHPKWFLGIFADRFCWGETTKFAVNVGITNSVLMLSLLTTTNFFFPSINLGFALSLKHCQNLLRLRVVALTSTYSSWAPQLEIPGKFELKLLWRRPSESVGDFECLFQSA